MAVLMMMTGSVCQNPETKEFQPSKLVILFSLLTKKRKKKEKKRNK